MSGRLSQTLHTHRVLCFPLASLHPTGMVHSEVLSPGWSPGLGTEHTGAFWFFELKLQRLLHTNTKDSVPAGASSPTRLPKSPPGPTVSSTFPKLHFSVMAKAKDWIFISRLKSNIWSLPSFSQAEAEGEELGMVTRAWPALALLQ